WRGPAGGGGGRVVGRPRGVVACQEDRRRVPRSWRHLPPRQLLTRAHNIRALLAPVLLHVCLLLARRHVHACVPPLCVSALPRWSRILGGPCTPSHRGRLPRGMQPL